MPKMKKIWIYMVGVAPFAFLHDWLSNRMAGPVFLAIAIAYFLVVRYIAEKYGKCDTGPSSGPKGSAGPKGSE